MSPYETQSIEIARSALTVSIWADIIAGIAVVAAIFGGIFAYFTLKAILAQLIAAQWSTLLSLEQDMASRRDKFRGLADQMGSKPASLIKEKFDEAKESYFNSIDRFATLVLNGQFSQRELKQDYQDVLKELIRAFPDDFNAGTRYRKVVKLYNKWEDGI
jgi:hypothetical protein